MRNSSANRHRSCLVGLVGLDGAGKTTQSLALVEAMGRHGLAFRRVPCRWDSPVARWLMRRLVHFYRVSRGKDLADYRQRRHWTGRLYRNRLFASLYRSFVLMDYLCQIWVKVKLPLLRGKNVVCDRYIYDTVVDLAADLGQPPEKMDRLLDRFFRLVPQPDIVFLIDLPEETALVRNEPKGEGLTVDYLARRRELYHFLAQRHGFIVLNGTLSAGELNATIAGRVLRAARGEEQ